MGEFDSSIVKKIMKIRKITEVKSKEKDKNGVVGLV